MINVNSDDTADNNKNSTSADQSEINFSLPPIAFSGMPKSASYYIASSIFQGLSMSPGWFTTDIYPQCAISRVHLVDFVNNKRSAYMHLEASKINLLFLCLYLDKFILHIRDPRNALCSWVHWIDFLNEKNGPDWLIAPDIIPYYGECWTSLSWHEKIEKCIVFFYSETLEWLHNWFTALRIDFSKNNFCEINDNCRQNIFIIESKHVAGSDPRYNECPACSTEVLLTTHEQFVKCGEETYFKNILRFYNIPFSLFKNPTIKKNMEKSHYRSGRTNTWKTELSAEQQSRVCGMLPQEWRDYFGWND